MHTSNSNFCCSKVGPIKPQTATKKPSLETPSCSVDIDIDLKPDKTVKTTQLDVSCKNQRNWRKQGGVVSDLERPPSRSMALEEERETVEAVWRCRASLIS